MDWLVSFLVVASSNLSLPVADIAPAADPAWMERARTEIPTTLERYRSLSHELSEETLIKYESSEPTRGKSGFRSRTINLSIHCRGNSVMLKRVTVFEDDPTHPNILLECRNDFYSFELRQQNIDSPYVLSMYNGDNPQKDVRVEGGMASNAYEDLALIHQAASGEKGLIISKMEWDAAKSHLSVSIQTTRIRGGALVTDNRDYLIDVSNNRWRIVERTIRSSTRAVTTVLTYGTIIDGESFPVTITETSSPATFRVHASLSIGKTTKQPDDFRLSAFGLPEPLGVPSTRRTPIYIWFIASALLCGGLALLIRYFKHRNKRQTA